MTVRIHFKREAARRIADVGSIELPYSHPLSQVLQQCQHRVIPCGLPSSSSPLVISLLMSMKIIAPQWATEVVMSVPPLR